MLSMYAPAVHPDELPTTRAAWHRRAGLTDPAVLALAVQRRIDSVPSEPRYVDFFHAR